MLGIACFWFRSPDLSRLAVDDPIPRFPDSGLGNPDSPPSRTSKVKRFMRVSASAKNPDEAALVGRIHAGDETAMADLYDRYSSIVYGVALRVLGNTTAAEDVLQEVFLQLWRNPQAF